MMRLDSSTIKVNWLSELGLSFSNITADSRQVKHGSLFIAYPGEMRDGRDYIEQAIQAGATGVLWESQGFAWQERWQVKHVAVEHLKEKVGEIAAEFYQFPANKIPVLGVTGTNGKTTVSQWLAQCLTHLGKKTAVIGTIGNGLINAQIEAVNTTPDAIVLQSMLTTYVNQGAKAVAMEVSSHGLTQGRLNGMKFEAAVLTNLSRDHLDYHQTMQAYAAAKRKLFDWPNLKVAIVNVDDAFGASIAHEFVSQEKQFLSYGMQQGDAATHVQGQHLQLREDGLSMQVITPFGDGEIHANVLGEFNAYNLLAVLATLLALEVCLQDALTAITKICSVTGRMQQLGGGNLPLVVIDYAHTPDALQKVLVTLRQQLDQVNVRQMQPHAQLSCVFGCGGDRDAGKRPLMGKIAAQYADHTIVTSDNPRSESPLAIIDEIIAEMTDHFNVEPDRASAIKAAIHLAHPKDIVLIAGKGHENYQEIAGVKYPFNDVLHAQHALDNYQLATGLQL